MQVFFSIRSEGVLYCTTVHQIIWIYNNGKKGHREWSNTMNPLTIDTTSVQLGQTASYKPLKMVLRFRFNRDTLFGGTKFKWKLKKLNYTRFEKPDLKYGWKKKWTWSSFSTVNIILDITVPFPKVLLKLGNGTIARFSFPVRLEYTIWRLKCLNEN